MGLIIEDGQGHGRNVGVTDENQLKVLSENHELQHHESIVNGQAYQVMSVDTGITAKTQTLLHIKNTDTTKYMVITFIRFQAITSTASKPVVGEYFEMGFGRTVASGGTVATPVNVNATSGNEASAVCTGIDPTMAGTFTAIDRVYNSAAMGEFVYNKQGSIILGLNDTFEVRLLSAGTGEAKCRVTFLLKTNGD